jgi:hypothetical protein
VTVTDPTPGVTLYDRAALDYPGFTSSTRTVKDSDLVVNGQVAFSLNCNNTNPDPSVGLQHQLIVIVADQMFDPGNPGNLEALQKPGLYVESTWQVDMSCMATSGTGTTQ